MAGSLPLRLALVVIAAALTAVGAGFCAGMDWATGLWPTSSEWPDRLAWFFVGSVMIAVAASAGYIAWTGDIRAAVPGGVALAATFTLLAGAVSVMQYPLARVAYMPWTAAFAVLALLAAALALIALRMPPRDLRRAPLWLTIATAAVAALLVLVGWLLVSGRPNVLPWDAPALNAVLYGCIFLGLAFNYALAALFGRLVEIRASMLGFVVYDLILIVPIIQRFETVPPAQLTSLRLYVLVLAVLGVVSVAALAVRGRSLPAPVSAGAV